MSSRRSRAYRHALKISSLLAAVLLTTLSATALAQEKIWHVKAFLPEGGQLDVKAIETEGNLHLLDIKVLVGDQKLPVKILVSDDAMMPVKAIGDDGALYDIKALTPDGKKLDIKGVKRSGSIIHIKAIGPDGVFYGVKAISPEGSRPRGACMTSRASRC